eukprot:55522_1
MERQHMMRNCWFNTGLTLKLNGSEDNDWRNSMAKTYGGTSYHDSQSPCDADGDFQMRLNEARYLLGMDGQEREPRDGPHLQCNLLDENKAQNLELNVDHLSEEDIVSTNNHQGIVSHDLDPMDVSHDTTNNNEHHDQNSVMEPMINDHDTHANESRENEIQDNEDIDMRSNPLDNAHNFTETEIWNYLLYINQQDLFKHRAQFVFEHIVSELDDIGDIIKMPGDGSCLVNAFDSHEHGSLDSNRISKTRKVIVNYTLENSALFPGITIKP